MSRERRPMLYPVKPGLHKIKDYCPVGGIYREGGRTKKRRFTMKVWTPHPLSTIKPRPRGQFKLFDSARNVTSRYVLFNS